MAQEAVDRVDQALREGGRPRGINGMGRSAMEVAADRAAADGWVGSRNTFMGRVAGAKDRYGLEPDWTLYRPSRYQQPTPTPVLHPAQAIAPARPDGEAKRILVIGDLHQDPMHPERLEVLTLIARYASAERFDHIVQIGDWSNWDSCNQHDKNDTLKARLKPSIKQDMENLIASHRAFRAGMAADYKPRLTCTYGNHEDRLERFENMHPEAAGIHTLARDEIFAQFGWRTRPYMELVYIEGVGFTHHATNGMGKAFGGKTGAQRAANETTVPVVCGHTHRKQMCDTAKIGPVEALTMVEVGCAMPWSTVQSYCRKALTGWWWGVAPMSVCAGQITDLAFVSMLELERRFGMALAA